MTTFPPKSPCPTCGSDLTLSAAPPVQMEAVAWRVGVPNNEYATLREDVAEIARKHGYEVTPLYASPVPSSSERSALLKCEEALRRAADIIKRNKYHQWEKIEDAESIARSALSLLDEARNGK